MSVFRVGVLLLLAGSQLAGATTATAKSKTATKLSANPIRRVVTMLQMMEKKVTAEGEKEKELFEKFMCYCKNGAGALEKSIDEAEQKIPQLESDMEALPAEKTQLESDIKQAKKDRADAKAAMAEATAIREKAAADFAKETAEKKADLAACSKAIVAIEKGMSGFLQTSAATVLRRLVVSAELSYESRDVLTAFLSQGIQSGDDEGYAPGSGEIVGILKQMKATMVTDLADTKKVEEVAIKDYNALMEAKSKEVDALTAEIEAKSARVGEIGVQIVEVKQDLTDTEKALAEDKQFLADLEKNCKKKEAEWEEIKKTRAEELLALADTIKLLNDDDALDLFKKTLPSPSLLQLKVTNKEVLKEARQALHDGIHIHDYRLDLISLSLRGKKVSFDKVIGMIDDMVALLKQEQQADNKKKAYCAEEFDKAEDEKKSLERTEGNLEKAIDDEKETIDTLVEEIKALEEGIKALDKAVAEATANRKEENAAYTEETAANNAALQIIDIAKNRMNKFYNPKLYKAPPKREMSEEERISVNMGGTLAPTAAPGGIAGTGVTALDQESDEATSFVQIAARLKKEAPPPPPATADAYKNQGEESNGVIAMMDLLIKDLKKEMTESKVEEENAQEDYEQFMKDSAEKRSLDAKAIAEKEAARADTTASLQKHKEELKGTLAELMANGEFTASLHGECDWLIQNFDVRKEARANEGDALEKAKAVLSGADYSLVQIQHRHVRVHMHSK